MGRVKVITNWHIQYSLKGGRKQVQPLILDMKISFFTRETHYSTKEKLKKINLDVHSDQPKPPFFRRSLPLLSDTLGLVGGCPSLQGDGPALTHRLLTWPLQVTSHSNCTLPIFLNVSLVSCDYNE